MSILVTGAAGFIGFHTACRLLSKGERVIGFDNVNDYYDVALKEARLERLEGFPKFEFIRAGLEDQERVKSVFQAHRPHTVINLAAQAGVRYGMKNPHAYVQSNIVGFLNILEACRQNAVKHLIFASSSSVYGANTKLPFSETDSVDHPISFYGASKKSNELMAHAFAHLYKLPVTGLRFFTVYGPWGRPDMALFKFSKAILAEQTIQIFNHGHHSRDFTYIDDIVEGIVQLIDRPPAPVSPDRPEAVTAATSMAPYRIYNIGNNQPVKLMDMIEILEKALGKTAIKELLPMQPGDVSATWADIDALSEAVDFSPSTPFETGVQEFVKWYLEFYG